jgi:hypothetical protein
MPFYSNVGQFHRVLQRLFEEIEREAPLATDLLHRTRLLIRLKTTDPTTDVWINARQRPFKTLFGHSRLHADVEVGLAADTLHQILLGDLSLSQALAQGQLEVRGPIWRAKALADLFFQSQAIYPRVLHQEGLLPS